MLDNIELNLFNHDFWL